MRPLVDRRRAEIETKIRSLEIEFEHWTTLTEQQFKRHHSQVRAIVAALNGMLDPVRKLIGDLPAGDAAVLAKAESWESAILAVHTIWDFFRAKLVLRQDENFRDVLAACDDFAWECYRPARERLGTAIKEPPLVFFSATWSPFALGREGGFTNEIRSGSSTAQWLATDQFQRVLAKLPIPCLGLPWYQASHLPGALILAHEVGHLIEWEFHLELTTRDALDRAGLSDVASWKDWASEVFADLYGCLGGGPAFAGAMLDLLAADPDFVKGEKPRPGSYPPRSIRAELLLQALADRGRSVEAGELRANWETIYGSVLQSAAATLAGDVPGVVSAIYGASYPGFAPDRSARTYTLPEVIDFAGIDYVSAGGQAEIDLLDPTFTDPRTLLAAARWIDETVASPGTAKAAHDRLRERMVKKFANAYRFRASGAPVGAADLAPRLAADELRYRQQGKELLKELFPDLGPD